MKPAPATLVWFRLDLRLSDNPALSAAAGRGGPLIPVFIWDPAGEGDWPPGAASRWWLHQSLTALDADLRHNGSRLVIRCGDSLTVLEQLAQQTNADALFWNRRYEPAVTERDATIESRMQRANLRVESFNSALLVEPWDLLNQSGRPFQVFTSFWKAFQRLAEPAPPLPHPKLVSPPRWPASMEIAELKLEPMIDWAAGLRRASRPGEAGAAARLEEFLRGGLFRYPEDRDRPAMTGTSRLSPHLHFGEISPRQVWHAVNARAKRSSAAARGGQAFLRELGWREFASHLLYHFPFTPGQSLRPEFDRFPWRHDPEGLRAWQQGRTGYPIVDAGMRELWTTGWMHNRVRMIVGSFLVKDLLIPWQEGARWFWDTLVDADLANNTLGWQWTAGCGADAAPFFRVFNPLLQGRKFDPLGDYVRNWVPPLRRIDPKWIHQPWESPQHGPNDGIPSGLDYPYPIVDHSEARRRALAAWAEIRSTR